LKNYEELYGSFPPVVVREKQGRPLRSWRIALLPYLDYPNVVRSYQFDKPWNAVENLALATKVDAYHCPDSSEGNEMTNYVALLRRKSAGDDAGTESADDQVWAIVEIGDSKIPWMSPQDIELDVFLERWKNGTWPSNHGSWWNTNHQTKCHLLVIKKIRGADDPGGLFLLPSLEILNLAMDVEEVKELLGLGPGGEQERK
jgi:hypothetical protein